jgi:hypothetical protein
MKGNAHGCWRFSITAQLAASACLALYCDSVLANTVWPFVIVNMQQVWFVPWVIGLGLAIESAILWRALSLPARTALTAGLMMNLASALLGLAVIGAALYFLDLVRPLDLMIESFTSPGGVVGVFLFNFLLLCAINTAVEAGVLKWRYKIAANPRTIVWLLLANALSISVACGALWLESTQCPSTRPWFNPAKCI